MSDLDPAVTVIVLLALVGVLVAFRGGARAARKYREVSRMGATLVRALLCGAVIVAVQLGVILNTTDPVAWGVVLGLPAVFAGAALARVFVVTTLEYAGNRKGRGRP